MTHLFYDVETTGLPDWGQPSDAPHQHRIIQLAMLMCDEQGNNIAGHAFLVKPDGWPPMSDEAFEKHGIPVERCNRYGILMDDIIPLFVEYMGRANVLIAHNISFDKRMMRIELKRRPNFHDHMEPLKDMAGFCTLRNSQKILNLPATVPMHKTGRHGAKPPSLAEAYQFFTGREFTKGHEAMADVVACKTVYFGIQKWIAENGPIPETPPAKKKAPGKPRAKAPAGNIDL